MMRKSNKVILSLMATGLICLASIGSVPAHNVETNKFNVIEFVAGTEPQKPVELVSTQQIEKVINIEPPNNLPRDHVFTGIDIAIKTEKLLFEPVTEMISDFADSLGMMLVQIPEMLKTISYELEGTTIRANFKISTIEEGTYSKEFFAFSQSQIDLIENGDGGNHVVINETEQTDYINASDIVVSEDNIFATNALSEYLASNMLVGNEIISLESFPESSDRELLIDAWSEAIYQNPLILGVNGAKIAPNNSFLLVIYGEDQKTIIEKQKEIRLEVERVVAEIISPEMTDLEKEIAINNYLCDSAEYDFDALENAKKNDFVTIDKIFEDSFTPYGILINKKGVCASYAGSFKLLADASKLESIVVTGYFEGTLPHAWNRVKIGNEWTTIDVTNNDNPLLVNAILNIPDDVAKLLLIEDDLYMGNASISQYQASGGNSEYYRITNRYFNLEEIADQLSDRLRNDRKVTLRTEYMLDDSTFQRIAQDIMADLDIEQIYGFHWMGVITMSLEESSLITQ